MIEIMGLFFESWSDNYLLYHLRRLDDGELAWICRSTLSLRHGLNINDTIDAINDTFHKDDERLLEFRKTIPVLGDVFSQTKVIGPVLDGNPIITPVFLFNPSQWENALENLNVPQNS